MTGKPGAYLLWTRIPAQYRVRGRKMKAINYWDKFMITGSIDDFLAYKNASQDDKTEKYEGKEGSEEHSHAGIYTDYGNGFKG